jgi:hypothetical protein
MPSSSRRGSYTSGNNSSHSSIDSTGLSQSTHSQSQSRNNSNGGEYDTMYGATLYLDGMMAAAAHDKSSPEKIANNVYNNSPPVQERTLTRTQDFMVVPSEVVYGPGGEKINKGIAYTALDGRMSSFKIPVSSSSYQEEAELRRLKREKAMMKSKLMRPCTERSPSNPNGSGILGGKNRPGSRTSIQKYKEGSNRMSMASNASSGPSTRRKSITGDKERASRSDSSTTNVIGSPHSTLLLNGSNNSMIILQPMEGLAPLIRPRSSGMSSQYLARSGWRRESITSIGSHDSVSYTCLILIKFYLIIVELIFF